MHYGLQRYHLIYNDSSMTPIRVTTLRIDSRLMDGLKIVKERDGIPVSEQVRRAIVGWLREKGIDAGAPRRGARISRRS
jgi:hypothetical protein